MSSGQRIYRHITLIALFVGSLISAHGQVFDAIIAADGSGDYASIQNAVDRIRATAERHVFYIKPGTYTEKISVASDNVSLIGAGRDQVIISWDDYSGDDDGHSTATSYTFEVSGDNFYAENITFENTAGNVGQAVAVSTTGDHQIFKNCRFLGFQDTYYARKGIQYLTNCYIEGATDFIFGESTAVFDQCEIVCLQGGQYITAPADTKFISEVNGEPFYHGFLFLDSEIKAGTGVSDNSYFLGRPWQPNSSSVYVNCTLGSHIKPEGWSEWDNNNHLSAVFTEYSSLEENGEPVDVSSRVAWSQQLSESQVENYNLGFFLDGWDPKVAFETYAIPEGLSAEINEGSVQVSWTEVEGASGYVIFKNSEVYSSTEAANFDDPEGEAGDNYVVASVNPFGVFSEYSAPVSVSLLLSELKGIRPDFREGILFLDQSSNVKIYSLTGQLMITRVHENEVNLRGLKKGVYLIEIEDRQGNIVVAKVAI